MKAKKGKIIMTITIGLVCFILTYVIFVQFKVVEETDITQIENARESELKEKLASWKERYDDVEAKVLESQETLNEYNERKASNQETSELVQRELQQAKQLVGITDVKGDGVVVTLKDNEEQYIDYNDLIELIDELRLAGAEAISINDKRIVNMSDIVNITGNVILINSERVTSPYVVKAIGDQKYLESALNTKTIGFVDKTLNYGKDVTLERQNNIKIYKYDKNLEIGHMKDKED